MHLNTLCNRVLAGSLVVPLLARGDRQVRDLLPGLGCADLGVASHAADQYDFIDAAHSAIFLARPKDIFKVRRCLPTWLMCGAATVPGWGNTASSSASANWALIIRDKIKVCSSSVRRRVGCGVPELLACRLVFKGASCSAMDWLNAPPPRARNDPYRN